MFRFIFLITLVFLSACSSSLTINKAKTPLQESLATAYDYRLLNRDFNTISLNTLTNALQDSQVIFIGEYHGNHAAHLLQMRVLEALHQRSQQDKRSVILGMEMFTRDQQGILDQYLQGTIGEHYLINEAPAWKNYQASYRPLVEYAKQHNIPVIAANAPADIIRCIGHKGRNHMKKLGAEQREQIAQQPFADIPAYKQKFFSLMGHTKKQPSQRQQQSYLAQITRDNTMAESIANALTEKPGSLVIHLNGSFHSENHLGAAGALKRLKPALDIKVITPLHPEKLSELTKQGNADGRQDDFYYLINPRPKAFVQADYQKKVHTKLFMDSKKKAKSCP